MDVDLDSLLDAVDHYAAKAQPRLFGVEAPDGDLEAVHELLADAATIGLLADVDDEDGWWGVWGGHTADHGVGHSLSALRRLGRVCAGLATAIHAQGLAVLMLGESAPATLHGGMRLAAGFCPPYGLATDPRATGDGLVVNGDRLDGIARFALAATRPDAVVLAARTTDAGTGGGEHVIVVLPLDTSGLSVRTTGRRVGLRATAMVDAVAESVHISPDALCHTGPSAERQLRVTMAADWLGQAAIALGCAELAISVAREYTKTRVQGGVAISEHAAIRLLLGRAEYDTAVVASVLDRHSGTPLPRLDTEDFLRWGADARLAAGEHATRAVTDALQTLGGYGYMDEYGLSKRLRDVTALRVLHGGPDQLLLARDTWGTDS